MEREEMGWRGRGKKEDAKSGTTLREMRREVAERKSERKRR